jgi:hypothetical protein
MRQRLPYGARRDEARQPTLDQRWARWQAKTTRPRRPTATTAWWDGFFWGWFWGSWR